MALLCTTFLTFVLYITVIFVYNLPNLVLFSFKIIKKIFIFTTIFKNLVIIFLKNVNFKRLVDLLQYYNNSLYQINII